MLFFFSVSGVLQSDCIVELCRPLSLTNYKQDKVYLRNLIIQSAKVKGLSGNSVSFTPAWEPEWWPNELWPWHMVKNFDKLKSAEWQANGLPDSPSVVLKKIIKIRLESIDKNPETWVQKSWQDNDEERKRATRRRGIRDVNSRQEAPIQENEDDNEQEVDRQENEDNNEPEYEENEDNNSNGVMEPEVVIQENIYEDNNEPEDEENEDNNSNGVMEPEVDIQENVYKEARVR